MTDQDVVTESDDNASILRDMNSPSKLAEILASLENVAGLSEEQKQRFKDAISLSQGGAGLAAEENLRPLGTAATSNTSTSIEILMLLGLISVVFLILVFFGYKLYNSLVERERRKEEKRRQKQQKKKK